MDELNEGEAEEVKVEEVRKTLIEVIKHLDTYSDRELVEIKGVADKLKEMAMYEEFCREKEETYNEIN